MSVKTFLCCLKGENKGNYCILTWKMLKRSNAYDLLCVEILGFLASFMSMILYKVYHTTVIDTCNIDVSVE